MLIITINCRSSYVSLTFLLRVLGLLNSKFLTVSDSHVYFFNYDKIFITKFMFNYF